MDRLRDLQASPGVTYLFISYDLKVVKALAHEVVVMRSGKIAEQGLSAPIFMRHRRIIRGN